MGLFESVEPLDSEFVILEEGLRRNTSAALFG